MYVAQNRAYLIACMNSRGGSTLTRQEFNDNRERYDLVSDRTIPWLLGQQSFQDKRCVWAHLSIPLQNFASEDSYETLEKAWFDWYQWWHPRFPEY